jgi:hypothetical protein
MMERNETMIKPVARLAAFILLVGPAAFGAVDGIINQQHLLTSLGSSVTMSGPSGIGLVTTGLTLVGLNQGVTTTTGHGSANQAIGGILSQTELVTPGGSGGLNGDYQVTTGGTPVPSGQNPTGEDNDQAGQSHSTLAPMVGSWVNPPALLPSPSAWVSPLCLWVSPPWI